VEPKTLGWGTLKESFENIFENLGVVSTPLKCFKGGFFEQMKVIMEEKGVDVFK
jgi:hypothetical protein